MALPIPASQLAQRIQALVEERQKHVDAIATIDLMLTSVGSALGSAVSGMAKRGRKPGSTNAASAAAAAPAAAPAAKGKKRRGRGHFALSAEESIINFVKENKNATTQDINKHFKGEGRSSTADNALSKMVREKQIKRTPLGEGIRGSYYSVL